MTQLILWDFDGTLGYRQGNWEETIFELSKEHVEKTQSNFDLISLMLKSGFPWHTPEKSFVHINNNVDWWKFITPRFIEIFIALGYDKYKATEKASLVPSQYTMIEKWKLYDDAIPNLIQLQGKNRIHVLVTNNVPEFPDIIKHLSIEKYFDALFVSSLIGFNKPNALILDKYLERIDNDTEIIVVGDREDSDILFAKVIGAKGILVRSTSTEDCLQFNNLDDLTNYLL